MGKRRIWHLSGSHHVAVFKTKVLNFKFENTPMKDTNGKKKLKQCSDSFLWTNESFSLWNCVSARNSSLFSSRRFRAVGLFWTNRRSEISEETWGTFCTLWSRKLRLLKAIFVFIKVSWTFSTFWHWRERKTRICAFEIDFFAMRSADWTWVKGSRIQLVLYANCFLGLTYGFFKKKFQEIKLFICHFAFITLAQNTIVRLQPQNVGFLETLQTSYSLFLN